MGVIDDRTATAMAAEKRDILFVAAPQYRRLEIGIVEWVIDFLADNFRPSEAKHQAAVDGSRLEGIMVEETLEQNRKLLLL